MMSRSPALLLAAVLAVPALAACSTSAAAPPVATSAPAPSSDRPRSISMTGLDPCSVLTDDQLRQLGIDPRRQYPKPSSAQCGWVTSTNDSSTSVGVQAITFSGIDDLRRQITDPTTSLTVQGFRALQWEHSVDADDPNFQIYVDVADGQALEVYVHLEGATNRAKAMQDSQRAADFAITNLLSR